MSPEIRAQLEQSERLMKAVRVQLVDAAVAITNLTVAANAVGTVALSGVVTSEAVRTRADDVARRVPGVLEVLNGLTIV